jgi:dipeptidyl aminopeptidase/acylaminoacyl peptidase
VTSVDKLRIPLLVVIGANDPRVPQSEADQIVAAVRAKGRTAWHLFGNYEGHCFAKMENIDYQFWTEVQFWKQNLLK